MHKQPALEQIADNGFVLHAPSIWVRSGNLTLVINSTKNGITTRIFRQDEIISKNFSSRIQDKE